MALTVAESRVEIAEAAGLCENDARVLNYINKACRRLIPKGKWKNCYANYRICTNKACLTWPRSIETIETVAVCGVPGTVRNGWYEFNLNGPGLFGCSSDDGLGSPFGCRSDCTGNQLVDRGLTVTFDDLVGTNKQLRVYADLAVDYGKTLTFRGYDDNRNIILTNNGDVEGETVILANPFVVTTNTNFWGIITQVIKQVTKGVVRVYEYDTVTTVQRLIAIYEPDETLPSYRKSFYPPAQVTDDGNGNCARVSVDVIAKLKFIPVAKDSDFILIGNLPALVEEVRAIRKFENNLIQEGFAYEQLAVKYLDEELQNYLGDGTRIALHIDGGSPFNSGPVLNLI